MRPEEGLLCHRRRHDLQRKCFKAYEKACKRGEVAIGKMFVAETGELEGPKYIINFPTKNHWRGSSRLAYIEAGLVDLIRVIRELDIASVAVPPTGSRQWRSGLGGCRTTAGVRIPAAS